ncbi:hypothetical protein [Motilimonas cestriensis]|uniref:hypothetical protein n=1 Tax=Motilimonas cestriensis TaxID=2742685 RepID=UPI003DA3FD77
MSFPWLNHFLEQIALGRSEDARLGNEKELNATCLLRIPLTEASVKISAGEVSDDLADLERPTWAGYLPYQTKVGPLQPVQGLAKGIETPDYSSAYGKRWQNDPG